MSPHPRARPENGPIDLEYDYINQNKRLGKEIDKENKKLQEKYQ